MPKTAVKNNFYRPKINLFKPVFFFRLTNILFVYQIWTKIFSIFKLRNNLMRLRIFDMDFFIHSNRGSLSSGTEVLMLKNTWLKQSICAKSILQNCHFRSTDYWTCVPVSTTPCSKNVQDFFLGNIPYDTKITIY